MITSLHPPTKKSLVRDFIFLTLFLSLLFGAFLGMRPLMVPDEGRYAEIPREMVESGNYLTPHLNYIKYFEKPALFYWMTAAVVKVFGINEWALRAIVSFMSLLACLMVYIAGLRLYDRRTGILGCLILSTCMLYFSMSRFVITDMPLSAWMTISLLLFILGTQESVVTKKRYYFWGMYICSALAVMTKGLVGAVLPGLIIFVWLCVTHEWKQLKTFCLPTGILLFLLIAAPWHVLVQLQNPEFFHFYFIEQHFLRYLTDYAGRQQEIWFFPVITLGGFFPWVFFLLAFLVVTIFQKRNFLKIPRTQSTTFFILWAVVSFVFFSFSKSQLLSYALPIMPPLAMLMARYFSFYWEDPSNRTIKVGFFLVALFGVLISVGGIVALQLNALPSSILFYAGFTVLLIGTLASNTLYRRCGIRSGIIALMITVSVFFVIGDVVYPKIDTRSIKPLIATIKSQLKPDTEIVVYHDYYQDLPAYLERRITVVTYENELGFGMKHQDTSAWMLDEKTFWQRWHNKHGMFMIVSKDNYAQLKQQQIKSLYFIDQTPQYILFANFR